MQRTQQRTKGAVEARRAAAPDSIATETLDGLLLDALVPREPSKVGACEIEHDLAALEAHRVVGIVGVLAREREDDARARSRGPYDDRWQHRRGARRQERVGRPLGYELVDFLACQHGAERAHGDDARRGTRRVAHLVGELDKALAGRAALGARLRVRADDEEDQPELKQGPDRVVLVRRLEVAPRDLGPGQRGHPLLHARPQRLQRFQRGRVHRFVQGKLASSRWESTSSCCRPRRAGTSSP